MERLSLWRHYCGCSNNQDRATVYPFNTIPRPALIYNQHDKRLMAGSQGIFPTEIWDSVLRQPPVRDHTAFRSFSMVNLYSYFACDEERTVHFARLATACIGTRKRPDQVYFNLYSVLDLLQDKTRVTTPGSRSRILGELIDEVVRFGLPKGMRSAMSHSAFRDVMEATRSLPASEEAEIKWRIVRGADASRMAISDRNDCFDTYSLEFKSNDQLPPEERRLAKLAFKVSRVNVSDGRCWNHTLDQLIHLIDLIVSLPQQRKAALLTTVAEQIAQMHPSFGCREASDAVIAACTDWPFDERIGVLAKVLGNRSYWEDRDSWQSAIGDLLAEFTSLPLDKKPAAIVHLIQLFASFLNAAHPLEPRHHDFSWEIASTLVEQAARLKSVHSSANVMAMLSGVVDCMCERSTRKTASILADAFSAGNEHEARTRARQLLCLRPWSTLLQLIADDVATHPKVGMTASLMYRIARLPYSDCRPRKDNTFHPTVVDEPCAIWTAAQALGSKRRDDVRTMLLEKMPNLPFPNMHIAFEKMLQDSHQLSPLLQEAFLRSVIAYSGKEDVEDRPPQQIIDSLISLVFSFPSRSLRAALLQLIEVISNKWIKDPATPQLITEVISKCLQLPPAIMVSTLIELAGSRLFVALERTPLAATLFHRMLEKSAEIAHNQKGPLLAALARLVSCLDPTVREAAFTDLLRQAGTLPENTRTAWHLSFRIAALDRLIDDRDPTACEKEADALGLEIEGLEEKPARAWLWPMLRDRVTFPSYPYHRAVFSKEPSW